MTTSASFKLTLYFGVDDGSTVLSIKTFYNKNFNLWLLRTLQVGIAFFSQYHKYGGSNLKFLHKISEFLTDYTA
jgi:hypothetical protein